jgi:hypothetical protein
VERSLVLSNNTICYQMMTFNTDWYYCLVRFVLVLLSCKVSTGKMTCNTLCIEKLIKTNSNLKCNEYLVKSQGALLI